MLAKRETFAPLVLFLVSAGIFLVTFVVRITLLPDIVPIADAEASQSVWGLEAAVHRAPPPNHGFQEAVDLKGG